MPSVEKQYCTHCGRKLPMSEFYSNGAKYTRHECKTCYKRRVMERRRKPAGDGFRYCSKCGALKPVSEFYQRKDGGYSSNCKACDRARAKADYHVRYTTKEGREKKRLSRAKYREEHRAELKEAERIRRRKAGVPPRRHIDKAKILKMYGEGVPVVDIARECGTTEHTVRQYAAKSGIPRVRSDRAQVCRNCWLYPCFKGIENFSTNFALTCRSWKLKSAKVKAQKNGENTACKPPKNANFTV